MFKKLQNKRVTELLNNTGKTSIIHDIQKPVSKMTQPECKNNDRDASTAIDL